MKYVANPVVVEAFTIAGIGECENGNTSLLLENGGTVVATKEMQSRYTPVSGDYWVIQSDGYIYLNPKEVFERKYRPQETSLGATGEFPEGKIDASDEGELRLAIGTKGNCVIVQMGTPTVWFGMSKAAALELAVSICKHAESL